MATPPSDTALAAAYQVTARRYASEQQLIWTRTALFVTLNGLVVAVVHFLPQLHPAFRFLIPLVGLAYSLCWHFSMKRAWTYHTFSVRMMREQECALHLGDLGGFTRGKRLVDGGAGEIVAGELTRFPAHVVLFKAKVLADATTGVFAVVYLVFLVRAVCQLFNYDFDSPNARPGGEMNDVLRLLMSAAAGGFLGALFSATLPRWLFRPRLKIRGLESHGFRRRLVGLNKGRIAATNAVGRLTIRRIAEGDIIGKRTDPTLDAFLAEEDWQTGIEQESVFWATSPNPSRLNLYPGLGERLVIIHCGDGFVDVVSEDEKKMRARLKLDPAKQYYGEVVIAAENSKPSKPFLFRIRLDSNGKAVVEPFEGTPPNW